MRVLSLMAHCTSKFKMLYSTSQAKIITRHPLVERLRALIHPPSPACYVRDIEQPITGVLSKPEPKLYQVDRKTSAFGKEPTRHQKQLVRELSLQSSALFARRLKR
jgi:hypothetical protein